MTRQLIVGMPESGKSTYIGALRHVLVAKQVDTELELMMLAGDEQHLNALEEKWLSCEAMERTKTSNEGWVELNVRDKATEATALMTIPDLRGENFERPAVAGGCPRDLHEALIASDGILLFTNVNHEDDMLLIDDFGDIPDDEDEEEAEDDVEAGAGVKLEGNGENGHEHDDGRGQFRPQDMGEEIKIVEFLQMANRRPLFPKRRKIALVASAWDLIADDDADMTPEKWLAAKRPMLDQFLAYNADMWELRVYGISAQGGSLPQRRAEFENMLNQSERVRVVGHGAGKHDLTAPLRWLMGVV
ncbi:hypothetical protein [Burkholderia glumae]|uniref:TRAFAC clade GTPase domain-containing protein n=1 Tax=Burkholderia glumae TaxID=337 RepID=UPI002150DEA1|nr:hypothetical protein [Burkholderia glumae]